MGLDRAAKDLAKLSVVESESLVEAVDEAQLISGPGQRQLLEDKSLGANRKLIDSKKSQSPGVGKELLRGKGKQMAAIPVDQSGEVAADKVAWTRERNLPYVPTPLAFGNHLYFWADNGVVTCLESATGKDVWMQRVGGKYWASPICIDGKIYNITDKGEVVVLASGSKYQLLGRTQLGEPVHSTPAVSRGRMFLRTFKHLYCLEAGKK